MKYGFWAVVGLQEARSCSTKHGTIGPKNMPSLIGAVEDEIKTKENNYFSVLKLSEKERLQTRKSIPFVHAVRRGHHQSISTLIPQMRMIVLVAT